MLGVQVLATIFTRGRQQRGQEMIGGRRFELDSAPHGSFISYAMRQLDAGGQGLAMTCDACVIPAHLSVYKSSSDHMTLRQHVAVAPVSQAFLKAVPSSHPTDVSACG